MEIISEKVGEVDVLKASGRIDAASSSEMKAALAPILQQEKPRLVVDLSGVDYIASAGLREFFLAGRSIGRAEGRMVLCSLHASVQRIFDISGLPTSYPIAPSLEEALVVAAAE